MKKYILISTALIFTVFVFAQNNSCVCCTEKHQEFDFWVGSWEVTNPDGTKAGENIITKVQDNCVIQENWTSASSGYTGTSNNFYNYKTKQWEQIWVDNKGQSLHLKGNKVDNKMIMRTDDETNAEGKTFFHRVTWTDNEDGTVRQLWETVTEGKETTIAFDGLYKRKS